jgi:hypothetical protein
MAPRRESGKVAESITTEVPMARSHATSRSSSADMYVS